MIRLPLNTKRPVAVACMALIASYALAGCGGGGGGSGATAPSPSGSNLGGVGTVVPPTTPVTTTPVTTTPQPNQPDLSPVVIGTSVAPQAQASYAPSAAGVGETWSWMNMSEAYARNTPIGNNTALGVQAARAQGLDGSGQKVGIVDGGIANPNSSDLAGKVTFIGDNVTSDATLARHGQASATIAAGANNGVAPRASIVAGYGITGMGTTIETMAKQGVPVINISLGSGTANDSLTPAEKGNIKAAAAAGSLMVFGVGNNGRTTPDGTQVVVQETPELQKNVIAVTGVSRLNTFAGYNQCGYAAQWCISSYVDYGIQFADGDIYRTGGTSNAAPAVSGAATLIKQKYPWADANFLRTSLLTTATDLGDAGVDAKFGWGLLNVAKAVNGPAQLPFGTLAMNVTPGNYWLTNDISGSGGFEKNGAGAITLTGNNTYTGGTLINAGTVNVNGSNGAVTLNGSTAILNGLGSVGTVNNAHGLTDFSYGLKAASYTAGANSVTSVAIGKPAQITGAAKLDGTLNVTQVTPGYVTAAGKTETVINAGSVTGTFKNLNNQAQAAVLLDTAPIYTSNAVAVKVTRVDANAAANTTTVPLSEPEKKIIISAAANTETALQKLDTVATNNKPGTTMQVLAAAPLLTSTSEQFNRSMYSLAAPVYGNAANMTALQFSRMADVLSSQMHHATTADGKGNFFAQGFQTNAKWNPTSGLQGKQDTSGAVIGGNYYIGNAWTVGAAYVRQDSRWTESFLQGNNDTAKTTGNGIALSAQYGTRREGFVQAVAAYSHISTDVARTVTLGGVDTPVTASARGTVAQIGVTGGKEFGFGNGFSLTPSIGLRYDFLKLNSFTEKGNTGFALNSKGGSFGTPVALVGLAGQWSFGQGWLSFGVGVEHDLRTRNASLDGSFTGMATPTTTAAWDLPRTRATASIGFGYDVSKNVRITADYQRQQAKGMKSDRFNAGLKYSF